MAAKSKYIPHDDTQNYYFYILQFVVETLGHSTYWTNQTEFKSPELLSQRMEKRSYKTLGIIKQICP